MQNHQRPSSLIKALSATGAYMLGMAGMMAGSLAGSLLVVPAAAAGFGYSMGGWISGTIGLALGAVANFIPLYKKHDESAGDAATFSYDDYPGLEPSDPEVVRVTDIAGHACGYTGGLIGAFTGAALGASLAIVVKMAEARHAYINADDPSDPHSRKKSGRHHDNF